MPYESFRPEVLAQELQVQRKRDSVFANCMYNGPVIGEIKRKGDVLRIAGTGRPTVRDYTENTNITLDTKDTWNQELYITQAKYINVEIDRIADKQMAGKVFGIEVQEAKRQLAQTLDTYLAGFHTEAGQTVEDTTLDQDSVLDVFAKAEQKLLEADVPLEEEKFLIITPAIYRYLIKAKVELKNPNADVFGKGYHGSYLNFNVFVSNSVKETGNVDHCMAFTRKAIALAEQIPADSIERYKPELRFADAFKVLHLYGATCIRPGELVTLDLTPVA